MKRASHFLSMLCIVLFSAMAAAQDVTTYTTTCKPNAASLNTAITTAIGAGKQPFGDPFAHSGSICQIMVNTANTLGRNYNSFRVGATAGWVVTGTNNGRTTLPASQTGSTLVIPISAKVGTTITAFSLIGQVESAGGSVTIDADLRKVTAAAADVTDVSIGAITQLAVTADTALSASNTNKTLAVAETVAAGETFYILVTATTAAATDIDLQGALVTSSASF